MRVLLSLTVDAFNQNLLMTKQRFAFYSFTQGIQYKHMGRDDNWHWVAKTNIQRARSDRLLTL